MKDENLQWKLSVLANKNSGWKAGKRIRPSKDVQKKISTLRTTIKERKLHHEILQVKKMIKKTRNIEVLKRTKKIKALRSKKEEQGTTKIEALEDDVEKLRELDLDKITNHAIARAERQLGVSNQNSNSEVHGLERDLLKAKLVRNQAQVAAELKLEISGKSRKASKGKERTKQAAGEKSSAQGELVVKDSKRMTHADGADSDASSSEIDLSMGSDSDSDAPGDNARHVVMTSKNSVRGPKATISSSSGKRKDKQDLSNMSSMFVSLGGGALPNNKAVVAGEQKKNRPGQRARRKMTELILQQQQKGETVPSAANSSLGIQGVSGPNGGQIVREKPPSARGQVGIRRQRTDNASEETTTKRRHNEMSDGVRHEGSVDMRASHGSEEIPKKTRAGRNREKKNALDIESIHPSWRAKREQKLALQDSSQSAQRIVFNDSD